MNCSALNMGVQLFAFYQSHDAKDDKIWLSLTILIKKLMKEYSAYLRPLLEYYLVSLLAPTTNIDLPDNSTGATHGSISIACFFTNPSTADAFNSGFKEMGRT